MSDVPPGVPGSPESVAWVKGQVRPITVLADERNVGMELMDAWNSAHQDGGVAVMAVMGHQDLAGYRFVIQANGADYQVTVRDVTELDGPA